MRYFAYISSIFRKSSLDELSKIARFSIVDEHLSYLIIDSREKKLQEEAEKAIFTYCAFPISFSARISERRYLETILAAVKKLKIPKGKALKLECVDVNEKHGYSAKDIEVKTGLALEKMHYNINIKEPEILAYVILLNGNLYAGSAEYKKLRRKFVNPMRHYHTKKQVSRAELKLREAFDEFGIKEGGTAIDLGAAPGGWSALLAQKGYKVIAIDNGELNKKAISGMGIKIKEVDAKRQVDAERLFRDADVIHVRGGFKPVRKVLKAKRVDLLTDDMNIFCSDKAEAIGMYLKFMKKDALFVVTVKCLSKNVPNYIARAKKMLGRRLKIRRIKVLPNNRQEITVLAQY